MKRQERPDHHRPPLTKILATIGPACEDEKVLRRLIESGATLFRLNLSHGTFEEHERRLATIRRLSEELQTPLTVLGDLPGPKIRIGTVEGAPIELAAGHDVILRAGAEFCVAGSGREAPVLGCNYARLGEEVKPGERVLIADGAIRMLAVEAGLGENGLDVLCRVTVGGAVTSRKGVNLPDSDLSIPAVTERDWECTLWCIRQGVDFVALSFVRRSRDVRDMNERIASVCTRETCGTGMGDPDAYPHVPVIAKIETPQAVECIDEILEEAAGIMVARGDLGVEMDLARVPVVQKQLVRAAHEHGKPCIVATQMLETMIERPSPTRAEVSDVANAILDGADAVMLSGETAVGKYPALAVETMRRVALATEQSIEERPAEARPPARLRAVRDRLAALAHGAWHMANDSGARLIVIWSQDGGAARFLSRHDFRAPILAFSSDPRAVRRMNLLHAVTPVLAAETPVHRSDFAAMAERYILAHGWAERGEAIISIGGKPFDDPRATNTVALRYAGEMTAGE